MKPIVTFLFIIALVVAKSQDNSNHAEQIMGKAKDQAMQEKKNIFIKFGASWCSWCKRMDALMHEESLDNLFKKQYVEVNFTVFESKDKKSLETPGAMDFLTKLGGQEAGLPFWVITDSQGNVLLDSFMENGQNSGSPASTEEVVFFMDALQKTSSLTPQELQQIGKKFTLEE